MVWACVVGCEWEWGEQEGNGWMNRLEITNVWK